MKNNIKPKYRKKTRELMIRIIFQMIVTGDFSDEAKDVFLADTSLYTEGVTDGEQTDCIFNEAKDENPDLPYLNYVFSCVKDNITEIDRILGEASTKWIVGRMSAVDLAILRVAVAEILYVDGIDDATSIDEAVLLAKKYSSESSPSFINGILGAVSRSKKNETIIQSKEVVSDRSENGI